MVGYYALSVLAFVIVLAALIYVDRKNIERKFGVLFLRRTPKGRKFIDRITRASPRFWAAMGDLGILAGYGSMVYGVYYLAKQAAVAKAGPGLALLIPLPSATGTAGFGYVGIPFWFFMIGVLTLVVIHEGFHAVQVRLANVRIKSMGLALLAILPGAFVEPDEKSLRKKSFRSQMRVYAAGSFGNFILAAVAGLFLTFVLSPIFSIGAVGYSGYVDPETYGATKPYPAQLAGLDEPIIALDGMRVESTEQFSSALSSKKPGDQVVVETAERSYSLRLAAHPEDPDRAFLGIADVHQTRVLNDMYRADAAKASAINFVLDAIAWIVILNVGIGLVNMFPIKPLDGGLLMEAFAKRYVPAYADMVMRASAAFMLVLIVLNFAGGALF